MPSRTESSFGVVVAAQLFDQTKALIDRLLLEKLPLAGIARAVKVSETWLHGVCQLKISRSPESSWGKGEKGALVIECDELL